MNDTQSDPKKIPSSQENPIDVYNIKLVDSWCGTFKSLGFTPNGLTTLSLIFGITALAFLWIHNFVGFATCYYISYLFDCLDGHYARKYKMVSKFGDTYDHVKDVSVVAGLISILFLRYRKNPVVWRKFMVATVIMSLLMTAQLGCQERLYPKSESATLKFSKKLCPGDPKNTIQFTKWFGCGTWVVYIIAAVGYLQANL
jgi:phosphatidylglycerophosphate synthase